MDKLITLDHVSKHFHVGKNKTLVAVNNVSLDVYKGETLGVVGESGCGKEDYRLHWSQRLRKVYPWTCGNGHISSYQRKDDV